MPFHFNQLPPESPAQAKGPIVVSMFTHKGGVGKTTGTYNLAALLAQKGARVLLVDADPQCNLSKSFIQAKIASQFSEFDEETLNTVTRKVARLFLKAKEREAVNVAKYSLVVCAEVFSSEVVSERFSGQVDSQFVIYRQQPVLESDDSASSPALQAAEPSYEWYLYGKKPDGSSVHLLFEKMKEMLDEKRINQILEGAPLDPQEQKTLMLSSAVSLENLPYEMDEVFQRLVTCKLVLKNDLSGEHGDELQDSFVLSRLAQGWVLYQCIGNNKPKQIDLAKIPGLNILLGSIVDQQPEALSDETQEEIKKCIKQYRFVNFLEVFNSEVISESVNKQTIQERVERLSLLSLDPTEINSELAVVEGGELLLLPGNYGLLLDLGREFSFGIKGLGDGSDFFKKFAPNIYGLNEFLHQVAEQCRADVVVLDLSPSADDFNSTLLMTSEYFLTTVNPEPYSDDAIESLLTILARWHGDFSKLYERTEPHASGCRLIPDPPKCLGYFLQKMAMQGEHLASRAAATIAADIKTIFDEEIVPLLQRNGMYPAFGLEGYDENAKSLLVKVSQDIPRFTKSEINAQYKGKPVVWGQDSSQFASAFARVLARTLGRAIVHDPRCSDRLKQIFAEFSEKQAEKDEAQFAKKWSDVFFKHCEQLSLVDRRQLLNTPYYRLDYIDMQLALASVRYAFNKLSYPSRLLLAEGSRFSCENNKGLLILDPCTLDQINVKLREALSRIETWPTLNYVIIPFFNGEHWMCARAQVNEGTKILSILIDDPRGGVLNKMDKVPGDKDSKVRNIIPIEATNTVIKSIREELRSYLCNKKKDRHWQFSTTSLLCKHLDQQGYLHNDVDSGVIVLSNIQDYLSCHENGSLYPNRAYEKTARQYKVEGVLNEYNMPEYSDEVDWQDSQASEVYPDLNLYTVGEYKPGKGRRSPFASEHISAKRKEFSEHHNRHKILYAKLSEDCKNENALYLKYYQDYLSQMLVRVPLDSRGDCIARFEAQRGYLVSQVVSEILFKVFNPANPRSRKHSYGDGDKFAKAFLKQVLKVKESAAPASLKKSKESRATDSSVRFAATRKKRSSLFERPVKGTLKSAADPSLKFTRYDVSPDGDCAYTAFGVTREKALQLLEANLNDEAVLELLKPAVHGQIIEEAFFTYLNDRFMTDDLSVAHDAYLLTHQKENFISQVNQCIKDVAAAYLEYDITDQKIDAGWCHPCVLQALAYIRGLRLRLWHESPDGDGTVVPYQVHQAGAYQDYADFNSDKEECKDLLYINGNHFELLMIKDGMDIDEDSIERKRKRADSRLGRRHDARDVDDDSDEEFVPDTPVSKRAKRSSTSGGGAAFFERPTSRDDRRSDLMECSDDERSHQALSP